jgi:hypothetical protein
MKNVGLDEKCRRMRKTNPCDIETMERDKFFHRDIDGWMILMRFGVDYRRGMDRGIALLTTYRS